MDKKKKLGHQERVNKGLESYVKTETPGYSLGSQASMDTIAMDNKSIKKLSDSAVRKAAIGGILKAIL
jgi:hypothetical protein